MTAIVTDRHSCSRTWPPSSGLGPSSRSHAAVARTHLSFHTPTSHKLSTAAALRWHPSQIAVLWKAAALPGFWLMPGIAGALTSTVFRLRDTAHATIRQLLRETAVAHTDPSHTQSSQTSVNPPCHSPCGGRSQEACGGRTAGVPGHHTLGRVTHACAGLIGADLASPPVLSARCGPTNARSAIMNTAAQK